MSTIWSGCSGAIGNCVEPADIRLTETWVDTVANLRTVLPGSVCVAGTLGALSVNDGGGGRFYWDATSTATDNTGTVVKPDCFDVADPGRWIRISDGNTVALKWFGVVEATEVGDQLREAYAALPVNGGTLVIEGTYTCAVLQDPLEQHWNQLDNNQFTYTVVELTKSNVTITGGGYLSLVGRSVAQALSFFFANKKDNNLKNLVYDDITLDVRAHDIVGAPAQAQWRAILAVSTDTLTVTRNCKLTNTSGASTGGYGIDVQNCTDVDIKATCTWLSGCVAAIFSKRVRLNLHAYQFNEAVDLDKRVKDAIVSGVYESDGEGEIVDCNASDRVLLANLEAYNCGGLLIWNGKSNLADTWEDHIANQNRAFRTGKTLTVADSVQTTLVGASGTDHLINIGNNWAGNPHDGVDPVGDCYIGGVHDQCGSIYIREVLNATINCQLSNANVLTAPAEWGAIMIQREQDFTTYPGAQQYARAEVTIGPAMSINGCNRNGIYADYPDLLDIRNGIRIRDCNSLGTEATPASIWIRGNANTSGEVYLDKLDIEGNGAQVAVWLITLLNYTVHIGPDCRIRNDTVTPTNEWVVETTPLANFELPQKEISPGTMTGAGGNQSIQFGPDSGFYAAGVHLLVEDTIAQSDTNYWTLACNRREPDQTDTQLDSITTRVTGGQEITAFIPASLSGANPISGPSQSHLIKKGDILRLRTVAAGTPPDIVNPVWMVRYFPF